MLGVGYIGRVRWPIALALLSAALFGLSAPAAKILVGVIDPWLLAGLLYAGFGLSLGALVPARRLLGGSRLAEAPIERRDWPWLAASIAAGGGAGPVLLMLGLSRGSAAEAALLLNLEGVFTALLAWAVFREHVDVRIAGGMAAIAAGAFLLAWDPSGGPAAGWPALFVAGACLAWALDNNLTRKVSASDPLQVAALKGVIAGGANIAIALGHGAPLPGPASIAAAAVVGLLGYGVSLVLYIRALRHLGAGRTGAYFSTAPFLGALGGVVALGEPLTGKLAGAALLMGVGVWLHVSERHEHEHVHEPLAHEHRHRHDPHHQHEHAPGVPAGEPHTHPHVHAPIRHSHPHYPDIHHRHPH